MAIETYLEQIKEKATELCLDIEDLTETLSTESIDSPDKIKEYDQYKVSLEKLLSAVSVDLARVQRQNSKEA